MLPHHLSPQILVVVRLSSILKLYQKKIILRILSNSWKQRKWGEVATHEVNDCFDSFLTSTSILCEKIKGETRLPMPSFDGDNGSSPALQNRISFLEAAITTWTKQIKNVLNQDPESQLKPGFHPTP